MKKSSWPHPDRCGCLACEMRATAGLPELTAAAWLRAVRTARKAA